MTKYIAPIATVCLGSVEIKSVLLEDGTFGITAQQANDFYQFSAHPNHASRKLKDMLGNGSKLTNVIKARTEENRNESVILSIAQFEWITTQLAFRGNLLAQQIVTDLVGLSLVQLCSDAHGIKFEKDQRANWLEARQESRKKFRPSFTDYLKIYGDSAGIELNYPKEVNCLKRALNLPTVKIDLYDEAQIEAWKDGLIKFGFLQDLGYSPKESYEMLNKSLVSSVA